MSARTEAGSDGGAASKLDFETVETGTDPWLRQMHARFDRIDRRLDDMYWRMLWLSSAYMVIVGLMIGIAKAL